MTKSDLTFLKSIADNEWELNGLEDKINKPKLVKAKSKSVSAELKESVAKLFKPLAGRMVVREPIVTPLTNNVVIVGLNDINACLSNRTGIYNPCPITHKLRSMFPDTSIFVNYSYVIIAGKRYVTPEIVSKFIDNWDKRKDAGPFAFVLKPA